jgi:hypothetical protein
MPADSPDFQQIHAVNISANPAEELQARVKDPLWFLARQWQAGEFEAESGGRPVQVNISSRRWQMANAAVPLEARVEAVENDVCQAWLPSALTHAFKVETTGHVLSARDYDGHQLDWHDFEVSGIKQTAATPADPTRSIVPTALHVPGAPHPSWWRLEDADAFFDSPVDPEPNILSLLLPEFSSLDMDNWHAVPMPVQVGCVDEITQLTVVDTFGIATKVAPAINDPDAEFALFTLPSERPGAPALGGSMLFLPPIAASILENDTLEEVYFMRDEGANLVWAWERLEDADNRELPDEPSHGYRLMASLRSCYIPYLPRKKSASSAQMILRRGRTIEDASAPQFKTQTVKQSVLINEEAISPLGNVVKLLEKAALGTDGRPIFWKGRQTRPGTSPTFPDIRFDFTSSP